MRDVFKTGDRFEGGAAIFDRERQDGPSGRAQGVGAAQDRWPRRDTGDVEKPAHQAQHGLLTLGPEGSGPLPPRCPARLFLTRTEPSRLWFRGSPGGGRTRWDAAAPVNRYLCARFFVANSQFRRLSMTATT